MSPRLPERLDPIDSNVKQRTLFCPEQDIGKVVTARVRNNQINLYIKLVMFRHDYTSKYINRDHSIPSGRDKNLSGQSQSELFMTDNEWMTTAHAFESKTITHVVSLKFIIV